MPVKKTHTKTTTLDDLLKEVKKTHGDRALAALGDDHLYDIEKIPTGVLALDAVLGGGLARGKMVEFSGWEGTGKTSIALKAIAEAQKLGKVVFIDAENAFDPAMAEKSGVDTDSLYVSQPDTAESSFEIIEDIIPAEDLAMIVIDSVEGLVPRAEIEGDYGDAFVGVKARLMSAALRKLSHSMVHNESQAVIVWINQLREKIGGMGYGPQNTTPGGKALKFWCSTRIEVARTGQVKQGEDVVGHTVKAKVVKNRFAPPFQVAQFDIIYGSGISNEGTILDLALSRGLVTKSGAWFADAETGENLGQGRMAVLARLGSDVELSERLTQAVMKL